MTTDLETETEVNVLGKINLNVCNSPIKPASGWASAPAGAKEFTLVSADGTLRRPVLILPNDAGIYDQVAIYASKKAAEPLCSVKKGELTPYYYDELLTESGEREAIYRSARLLELAEDGSRVRLWLSLAYITHNTSVWPRRPCMSKSVPILASRRR